MPVAGEPIAVIGLACRFPGAPSLEAFWDLLLEGKSGVSLVPPERWDAASLPVRHGGFLTEVDRFDAEFFGIPPGEAASMDPQQRLLLQVAYHALEHAAIPASKLSGSRTGVFVGVCNNDYARLLGSADAIEMYTSTRNALSVVAGRVSYVWGLQGPSLAVDTSCSSSLVAVHLACQSLRQGECDLALAGGVNLTLALESTLALARLQFLSPSGRCQVFAAGADGFVRGEGCGVVVLKRLNDAIRDGDRVETLIRGSAVNHDGRSGGLTTPNGPAQEKVLHRTLEAADVEPASVQYVEAHGTGTVLGDPIELRALGAVMGRGHTADRPLWVGSVKTNFGHREAAAGIAGLHQGGARGTARRDPAAAALRGAESTYSLVRPAAARFSGGHDLARQRGASSRHQFVRVQRNQRPRRD